jgi:hypothetical protein
MSMTAAGAAFFCFVHDVPLSFASVGRVTVSPL